jgi:hypothetical protein
MHTCSPPHTCACRFVTIADNRSTKESQRFWFSVIDLDGDGFIGVCVC